MKNYRRSGELTTVEKVIERGVETWYVDPDEVRQVARKKRDGLIEQPEQVINQSGNSSVDPPERGINTTRRRRG